MGDISRAEFAEAVAAAIGSIHHLYREVGRLYTALREGLQGGRDPFVAIGGLPAKAARDPERTIVRNYYGQLFEPLAGHEGIEEEEDEEEEDEEVDEDGGRRRRKPPLVFTPDRTLLAVKLQMFDDDQARGSEPEIQYGVIGDWGVGPSPSRSTEGEGFELGRHMVRRIIKAFGPTLDQAPGQRVMTRAMARAKMRRKMERNISYRLLKPVQRYAIYELESADALEKLVRDIKAFWSSRAEARAPEVQVVGSRGGTVRPR